MLKRCLFQMTVEREGSDAVVIDDYGVAKNKEGHCSECNAIIASLVSNDSNTQGDSANDLSFQPG